MSTSPALAATMKDVQASPDTRGIPIDQVGIDGLSYPLAVTDRDGRSQQTVGQVAMTVALPDHVRGVHMSRFVEVLHERSTSIGPATLPGLAVEVRERLGSPRARIELRFPYFLTRSGPSSGMESFMEYEASLVATSDADEVDTTIVGVRVPVTSLCPCSKEISDYGAHNQRGHVEIEAASPWPGGEAAGIWIEDLVDVAEAAASAPVLPLLKRTDEREMTMRAYDNPAFVEDITRDVSVALREDVRVSSFRVRVANQESIHNHNAVAELRWSRAASHE